MYPEDECHDRNADQADNSVQQIRDDFFEGILSLHVAGFRFAFHGWRGNCDKYRKAGSPGRPDLQAWTPDRSNPARLDAATLRDSRKYIARSGFMFRQMLVLANQICACESGLCSRYMLMFPTQAYVSATCLSIRHILRRCFARDLFKHLVEG